MADPTSQRRGWQVARTVALGLLMAGAVDLVSVYCPRIVGISRGGGGFIPPSFPTHTTMWILSLPLMWLLSRGNLGAFGFTRGSFRFTPRILLWALPTAVLSTLSAFASAGASKPTGPGAGFTPLQTILFIWIYASICEEILTRGLLQGCLSRAVGNVGGWGAGGEGIGRGGAGGEDIGRGGVDGASTRFRFSFRLSMPVVTSALFFGAMHAVLIPMMGPAAAPIIVLATGLGLVAGHYREKTGSLLPAIIIHALFNIGGTIPTWVVLWIRRG